MYAKYYLFFLLLVLYPSCCKDKKDISYTFRIINQCKEPVIVYSLSIYDADTIIDTLKTYEEYYWLNDLKEKIDCKSSGDIFTDTIPVLQYIKVLKNDSSVAFKNFKLSKEWLYCKQPRCGFGRQTGSYTLLVDSTDFK
jgi:hypothetical protein